MKSARRHACGKLFILLALALAVLGLASPAGAGSTPSVGELAWARSAGGANGGDLGSSVAVLDDGSAWVTGRFNGNAIFGAGESHQTTLTGTGNNNFFLARYFDTTPPGELVPVELSGFSVE